MRHLLCSTACLGFVAFAPAVMAQGAADSGWTYQMQLYLWGTEVGGEALGNDFELGFDTLLENLNFALMGGLKAYNGDWMGYGELSYADVGFEKGATVNVGGVADVDVDLDSDVQTTIVSFGGGYRVINEPNYTMYATGGLRYLSLDSHIELEVANRRFTADGSDDYWDAVIGLNGEARFGENWFVPWVLDVGAGQSDLTWQAGLGVGYRFGRNDVVFGYRHMEWDLPEEDTVSNYYQSGPMLMWNFRF